ncbi:TonB-dependent siderophore receptor [Hyphomicrobium sp. ghe19]|uniref:TonB-dependent siderophore receptor n=1 Tax=Hyphomicrobium sp. ghe19 TaxID=2682968 RepID=UPI001366CE90|nr:Ferrichrome-iron receptor [Hyphomicrobium sp. ghe19]
MVSIWVNVRVGALGVAVFGLSLIPEASAQETTPLPLPDVVVEGGSTPAPTAKKPATKSKAKVVKAAAPTAAPSLDLPPMSDGSSAPPGSTDGYVAKASAAATKTETPLREVPQSISTVTRQQLQDRNTQNLGDAIQYVPGVRVNLSGYDPRFDTFNIRGFDATYTGIYRDGLRQMSSGFGQFRTEPYGLDSITVLRGPTSSLYGASNAGGIVDMYSKRPTETPFREVEVQIGNYDRYQGNFDFSGPSTLGNSVLYRFTGVVRDSGTQAMGVPDDRVYLAPALTFKIDPNTKLTILGEYMDAQTGGNMAWYNDDSSGHARRTNIWSGDPAFNGFDQTQERIGYEFEHRFNDIFTFRQNVRYSHISAYGEYIDIVEEIEPNVWSRANGIVVSDVNNFVTDTQLEARFSTGPLKHVALAGVDVGYVWYKEGNGFGDPIEEDGGIVPPLVNYNYGQTHIPTPAISTVTHQDQLLTGTYLQDQVKLDRWVLTLGGRHDWVSTDTDTDGARLKQNDAAWTGRAGLSYLFDSGLSPYVAYGTGFVANSGTDFITGKPFDASKSESKEVGLKYFVPGYNASISSAVFDIQQTNGIQTQCAKRNNVTECGSVQTGVLRSRGFEIEGTATLDNGLSLLASYSYIDMRIEDDTAGTEGNVLSSIPFNTASFWGDYTLRSGPAAGLGFGFGVRYIGSSFGDDENTFKNAGHTLFDMAAHYDLSRFDPSLKGARLQLNINNVADKEVDVCSSNYCYLDQGRTVIGSLRYRW